MRMMTRHKLFPCLPTRLLLVLLLVSSTIAAEDERKMYIIYMGSHLPSGLTPKLFYDKMMTNIIGSDYSKSPSEYLLHTYERSFYGCVAKLTDAESQQVAGLEGVVSVFPNEKMELQTTRSWDFMSFPITVPRNHIERDIIVGMFDSGIWPESPSFNDAGLGPVPAKWKGICQKSANFSCNKKIIGARFYKADKDFPINEGPTPRDFSGHGTHTSSTVAGALVPNANFSGLASGIVRGGVPSARIAVYKVCWTEGNGCASVDILSAFDDAIADGVDIISMSVGPISARPYFAHANAIGAFHAMQRGILASFSAGNSGPSKGTVGNTAPWIMSVAASTTDRKFVTGVRLGNNKLFQGQLSLNTFDLRGKKFPLIYGADAPNSSFPIGARFCSSLNRTLVQGKIVVCDINDTLVASQVSIEAGVAGTVMRSRFDTFGDGSTSYPLPSSIVRFRDGNDILSYTRNLSRKPEATILKTNIIKDKLAPYVASFSSRGPNPITPTILKPDLSAPGVDILAAYSPKAEVSGVTGDTRSVTYHIISGTSMACPHASASAAYVKSYHPDWSPAAIRSALMTTAIPMSSSTSPEAELAYGSGHINPKKAVDPGLVYNATETDYVNFLCGQGYNIDLIRQISRNNHTSCPKDLTGFVGDLNYPSITIAANSSTFDKIFQRRVAVVTKGSYYPSVYKVKVTASEGVSVKVKPESLCFTHPGEELTYTVRVKGGLRSSDEVISASIEWLDGVHTVRSPIVAFRL